MSHPVVSQLVSLFPPAQPGIRYELSMLTERVLITAPPSLPNRVGVGLESPANKGQEETVHAQQHHHAGHRKKMAHTHGRGHDANGTRQDCQKLLPSSSSFVSLSLSLRIRTIEFLPLNHGSVPCFSLFYGAATDRCEGQRTKEIFFSLVPFLSLRSWLGPAGCLSGKGPWPRRWDGMGRGRVGEERARRRVGTPGAFLGYHCLYHGWARYVPDEGSGSGDYNLDASGIWRGAV
ncbi:uncharacterized protein K460DRAFT_40736 [Cucurbitaria berberidis CBS 394.84]|uniref:Uncharacterized protein n=1 Tax=Cucurbitaria berberidis CBS 394.84 TaxID=1168544 RepID=A0A9P4GUU4_9PLEO|nr:uncharacterized protein K460DRAFT_40736 [Cucurbitaria berberidis CBS 394.84]KAF1851770.1 hypothetical protein K460DRAFT_40736 [Cucurbitaria berberidis CBS 394.84]